MRSWRLSVGDSMLGLLILTVMLAVLFVDNFATSTNLSSVLRDAGFLGLVAVGMTFVVATGNFVDLSVVAQIATAGVVVTTLERFGLTVAVLGALLSCLAFATINWLGVAVLTANCVIVTIAVETAGAGLLGYLTHGDVYNGNSGTLHSFMTSSIGPIPIVFVICVVAVVCAQFVLVRTRLGRGIRAVGINRAAAAIAGVRTKMVLGAAFGAVAVMCALAGIALAGFNGNALAGGGDGYDFQAVAAVVIGGNSLLAGNTSSLRTLVGVLFLIVTENLVTLVGLSSDWQQVVLGAIIVVAVCADVMARRRHEA